MGPGGGTERSPAEAWAELLDAHRPHSVGGDDGSGRGGGRGGGSSSPSLWLLLQAACRERSLGAMYPWISMRQLSVSAADSWEEWGREPLPAMFARPDTYLVVDRPAGGDRVALETPDPAEAAAFAAQLLRNRQTVRTAGPHVWSAEVEAVLRGAGWYPGRSVDTAEWRERLEADGFQVHPAAEAFLREFGGLTVGSGGPGITRARQAFELDPLLALGEDDRFGEWGEEIGRRLAPLGELDHGRSFLGLDEHGELYTVVDCLARFGRLPEAMENLVLGVMPIHKPAPRQS